MNIRDLIGKPYTPEHDCNWLVREASGRYGVACPEITTPKDFNCIGRTLNAVLDKYYTKTRIPVPGGVAVHRFFDRDGREHWHCSFILESGDLLTTREAVGVHIIKRRDRAWRTHLIGYYAYKTDTTKVPVSSGRPVTE